MIRLQGNPCAVHMPAPPSLLSPPQNLSEDEPFLGNVCDVDSLAICKYSHSMRRNFRPGAAA